MTAPQRIAAPGSDPRGAWPVAAASFAGMLVSFAPLVVFPFGLFLKELTQEFHWSRGAVSAAFSMAAMTVAFMSPVLGKAADRWGAPRLILFCGPAFGLLFASLRWQTTSLLQLYGVFIAIGVVANGAAHLAYARLVSAWFDRRRGLALSLVMTGAGVGAIVMPVLAERLIRLGGWRNAYLALGLLSLAVTAPLAAFVLKEPPAKPPGERTDPVKGAARMRDTLRSRPALIILASSFLLSLGANGCVAHLAPLLTDAKLSAASAALVTSILGAASIAGRFLTGALMDRFFAARIWLLFSATSAAAMLLLVRPSLPGAALSAVLLGLAMGAEADLVPYLISKYFGIAAFGELYGYTFTAYAIAGASGPFLMGFLFDRVGSYAAVLVLFAATTVCATALIAKLPRYGGASTTGAQPQLTHGK